MRARTRAEKEEKGNHLVIIEAVVYDWHFGPGTLFK